MVEFKNKFLKFHLFHIVDESPWPIVGSFALFSMIVSVYYFLSSKMNFINFLMMSFWMLLVLFQWWRDVVRESFFQGNHSKKVKNGLKLGMFLFILSEVMFFFSFFYTYFFYSLNPETEVLYTWPPTGVKNLDYLSVPLLNTLLLLSSGVTLTWSHHMLLNSNKKESLIGMILTIILGIMFSYNQVDEYWECSFSMADSIFGSIFFIATGFHGIHVFIGTIFIFITMIRLKMNHFSKNQHIGFELSAWYWHFVDVIWLFLFLVMYYWVG
nr:cytochrome c oxidase subunit 3 [Trichophilopterus babakotophilus]